MSSAPNPIRKTLLRASARASGIASGLVLGVALFTATLVLVIKGGTDVGAHLGRLAQVFPGYDVTVRGAFLGFVYAFVVGYALGRLFAPRAPVTVERVAAERGKHLRLRGGAWGATLGIAFAVVVGGVTFALTLRGGEHPGDMLEHLAIYFPGYTVSYGGALLGAGYAFALGWLLGRLIAAVYNATVGRAEARLARS